MYIISACLLGENCKYSGGNNENSRAVTFAKDHSYIAVCPETTGGLEVPRPPCETIGDRVMNSEGLDVTENFVRGAAKAYEAAETKAAELGEPIEGALLKANSPSCGCGRIYDGTFSGRLIGGDGIFAKLLKEKGIEVVTEEDRMMP